MRCVVLGARRYDFKDDAGGRVEGVTLHYLTQDGIEDANQKGNIPLQVSAPSDVYHQLSQVPAEYDIEFRQRPGRGGKPTLTAAGVSYVGEASFDAS